MLFVAIKQLAIQTGLGAFNEHISSGHGILRIYFDLEFLQFLKWQSECLFVSRDDDHWVHALLDVVFGLFEQLPREQCDRGGAIAHLIILINKFPLPGI